MSRPLRTLLSAPAPGMNRRRFLGRALAASIGPALLPVLERTAFGAELSASPESHASPRGAESRDASTARPGSGGAAGTPASVDPPDSLNRRTPAARPLEPNALPSEADVVVVGAGFAGLAAARRLSQAGRTVAVLEARDRLGGRTWTEHYPNDLTLDIGGQWIGPTQRRVNALVKELGVETFPTWNSGRSILEDGGRLRDYAGAIPKLGLFSLLDLGGAMSKLDKLAKTVDLEEPWRTPDAERLDAMTLATWIDAHLQLGPSRRLLVIGLEMVLATNVSRVSLLFTLFFIKSAGGLAPLLDVAGGAQQDRFKHGSADLVGRMVEPFRASIHLNAPVRSIQQDANGATVITQAGQVRARRVIVAVPPALAGRIDYSPQLDASRDQLTQAIPGGQVVKCLAFYPRPFWRDRGLTGQAVSTGGYLYATFDNSLPGSDAGVLVGFSIGAKADQVRRMSPGDRQKAIVDAFARFFGPDAAKPTFYVDHCWSDEPWTRGCFFGHMGPGIWTSLGPALRRPEGRIHWAGTETAREWYGYIEGAIESGERAAQETLEAT